ncbi:MAG: EAL domain-containing protein [Lachnospiraceae bacterium]
MLYNLSFEYISVGFCLFLLYIFFHNRKSGMIYYHTYNLLIITIMIASLMDIFTVWICDGKLLVGNGIVNLFNMLFLMTLNSIPPLFVLCVLSLADIDFRKSKTWKSLILIPWGVQLFLILTTPMTGLIFYVDETGTYCHGKGFFILMGFLCYYCIINVVASIFYRKILGRGRVIYLVVCMVLGILSQLVQVAFPQLLIQCFAMALICSILIYMTKNPDEIFDQSGAMYASQFYDNVLVSYKQNEDFNLLVVRFYDLELLEKSFGEEDFNLLLRSVVSYFNSSYPGAKVYRLDERNFAIHVHAILHDQDDIIQLQRELMYRLQAPFKGGNMEIVLPGSVMLLQFPFDAPTFDDFKTLIDRISRADNPKNSDWLLEDLEAEDKKDAVLQAVKNAVEKESFRVYYQPIYATREKKIVAAEALIRLFDDEIGFVSPEIFIPLAEQAGYIDRIGRFVFREVCRFYAENHLQEKGIDYIEINLSPLQCMQYEMAVDYLNIMKKWGIKVNQVNFEITETAVKTENPVYEHNINKLVDSGIALSLDDYGTGFSNLTFLSSLPFHYLKIDKSLLWSADTNEKADITLRNTIEMAKALDMKLVVEGVETVDQVNKLLAMEVDYFQGYYYSKPISGDDFITFISALHDFDQMA